MGCGVGDNGVGSTCPIMPGVGPMLEVLDTACILRAARSQKEDDAWGATVGTLFIQVVGELAHLSLSGILGRTWGLK